MPETPFIFFSAGEASGDHYGAEIIAALRERLPDARFFGLGGTAMEGAGLERVVRAEDVAVMGVTEILRHIPRILRSYRKLVASMRSRSPAAAVLIDFPDVNFRLARQLRLRGVPVVWFVSPQLWAWKRGRLRWVQERVDRMLVIFPFEERFYQARGVAAEFVGHPLAAGANEGGSREAYAERHLFANLAAAKRSSHLNRPWVALLPGSRWKEVTANLPVMLEAAKALGTGYDFLIPVASTLTVDSLSDFVFKELLPRMHWDLRSSITLVPDAREALQQARASVVASGTATVLAAVVGNPFVVVYRVSAMTFRVAKRLVRYPAEIAAERDAKGVLPVAMVNLLAGRRVVPELINEAFTAGRVAAELRALLEDGAPRDRQIEGLKAVREALWPEPAGRTRGTARVAEVVLEVMELEGRGEFPA